MEKKTEEYFIEKARLAHAALRAEDRDLGAWTGELMNALDLHNREAAIDLELERGLASVRPKDDSPINYCENCHRILEDPEAVFCDSCESGEEVRRLIADLVRALLSSAKKLEETNNLFDDVDEIVADMREEAGHAKALASEAPRQPAEASEGPP